MWALAQLRYGQNGCQMRVVGKTIHRELRDQWADNEFELDLPKYDSKKFPAGTTVRGILVNLNWEMGDVDVIRLMIEAGFIPIGYGKWFYPEALTQTIAEIMPSIVDSIWGIFKGEEEYVTEFSLFGMRQTWNQRQAFLASMQEQRFMLTGEDA